MESGQNRLNLARLYFKKARADLESARHLSSLSQYANAVFLANNAEKKLRRQLSRSRILRSESISSPDIWLDSLLD